MQPVFRRELEKCVEVLRPVLEVPLLDVFFAPSSKTGHRLDQLQYTQPALFAFEYALAGMWQSWGVEPVAVLGHNVGEYVAACVAGVFSLEDGLRLVVERARLMDSLPDGDAMAGIFADESPVAQAIRGQDNHVAFQRVAASVRFSEPLIPIVSSVVGTVAGPSLMSTPEYWTRQIHCPVRSADSIRALQETKPSVLLEIGLHPVPNGASPAIAPEGDFLWASSLNRDQEHSKSLLEAVSALYVHGVNFNWGSLLASSAGKRVPLPTYPFQRDRFWLQEGNADVQRTLDEDLRSETRFAQQESPSGETPALAQNNPADAESDFIRNLRSATPTRRRDLLIAHLRSLVATVLGFDPSREIDLEHGLFELGMDSIMSVEFSRRLGGILCLQLPATLTFIYPNIKALTDYILFEALKFDSETEDTVNNPLIDPVNDLSGSQSVDDLSEDELANLLLKKLEQLK